MSQNVLSASRTGQTLDPNEVAKVLKEFRALSEKVESLERAAASSNGAPKWVFDNQQQLKMKFLPDDISPVGRYCVLYRVRVARASDDGAVDWSEPMGRVRSIEIPARCPADAFKCVASPGIFVLDVSPVVFDANEFWNFRKVFDKAGAALFCQFKTTANINTAMAEGKLPKAREGSTPRFWREELLKFLEAGRTADGKFHVSMEDAA